MTPTTVMAIDNAYSTASVFFNQPAGVSPLTSEKCNDVLLKGVAAMTVASWRRS